MRSALLTPSCYCFSLTHNRISSFCTGRISAQTSWTTQPQIWSISEHIILTPVPGGEDKVSTSAEWKELAKMFVETTTTRHHPGQFEAGIYLSYCNGLDTYDLRAGTEWTRMTVMSDKHVGRIDLNCSQQLSPFLKPNTRTSRGGGQLLLSSSSSGEGGQPAQLQVMMPTDGRMWNTAGWRG